MRVPFGMLVYHSLHAYLLRRRPKAWTPLPEFAIGTASLVALVIVRPLDATTWIFPVILICCVAGLVRYLKGLARKERKTETTRWLDELSRFAVRRARK